LTAISPSRCRIVWASCHPASFVMAGFAAIPVTLCISVPDLPAEKLLFLPGDASGQMRSSPGAKLNYTLLAVDPWSQW